MKHGRCQHPIIENGWIVSRRSGIIRLMMWRTFGSESKRQLMKCLFEMTGSLYRRNCSLRPNCFGHSSRTSRRNDGFQVFQSGRVLYTHTLENGKRLPIRLKDYPKARAYLECHRERLSSRRYVIEAGRQWYEIWVPHNPMDWSRPKIASPDISEEPRFCFEPNGAIVNGDCYWMTLRRGFKSDWLLLLLAVANSSFVTRYYDIAFHNKLYAGRRRFMTQYVKKFPLPHLETPVAQRIIQVVGERIANKTPDEDREMEIDQRVWESFGLVEEACG